MESLEYKSIISFVQEFSKRKSSSAMTLCLFARHTIITMELAGGVVEKTVIVVSPPGGGGYWHIWAI